MKPVVAQRQLDTEKVRPPDGGVSPDTGVKGDETTVTKPDGGRIPPVAANPKRFHGTVILDPTRVGRDASRIADEVIVHLSS